MNLYIVKYRGDFGFIKPFTAVRDDLTFSQQFLTESMVFGIERKLFPELLSAPYGISRIVGHRLSYHGVSQQQEQIQPRGFNVKNAPKQKGKKLATRPKAVLTRGVLISPQLFLAFKTREDAEVASRQHICLARNEDMLFPDSEIIECTQEEFNSEERFSGFELVFEKNEQAFMVGYNRFQEAKSMYGWLRTVGTPVKEFYG